MASRKTRSPQATKGKNRSSAALAFIQLEGTNILFCPFVIMSLMKKLIKIALSFFVYVLMLFIIRGLIALVGVNEGSLLYSPISNIIALIIAFFSIVLTSPAFSSTTSANPNPDTCKNKNGANNVFCSPRFCLLFRFAKVTDEKVKSIDNSKEYNNVG